MVRDPGIYENSNQTGATVKELIVHRAIARRLLMLAVTLALLSCLSLPAGAKEAAGDLNIRLRLLEVIPDEGTGSGTARVEATLESFPAIQALTFTYLKSDGTPWTPATLPVDPGDLEWIRGTGENPEDILTGQFSLLSRDTVKTIIEVTLEDIGIYEIVVRVSGTGPSGPESTEAMVLAPLGVNLRPPEVEGVVEYRAEVRP